MRGITGVDLFGTTDAVVKHVLEVLISIASGWIWALLQGNSDSMLFMYSFLQQRLMQGLLSARCHLRH